MRCLGALLVLALSLLSLPVLAAGGRHADKPHIHVVYRGQTLGTIAKRYHVSILALCRANGLKRSAPIKPKQKLVIPGPDDPDGSRAGAKLQHRHSDAHAGRRASMSTAAKQRSRSGPTSSASSHRYARRPRRRGYLILHSGAGAWRGYAVRHGKLTRSAEQQVSRVLSSWRTGKKNTINPRLIQMLARVSDHFGGRPIRVVSGFRPYRPTQYTPHSRHNLGRAVDFSIPGVPNEVLRDYCRTLPRVGCGFYPNSSFVHMDVRRISAYWIDLAGPGQPPRYAYVGGSETTDADEGAADSQADAVSRTRHHVGHRSPRRHQHGSSDTHSRSHEKPHRH
jgi:uncharacterized protein YcbK (DUF882 family)